MDCKNPIFPLTDSLKKLVLSLGGRLKETESTVNIEYCLNEMETLKDNEKLVCIVLSGVTFQNGAIEKKRRKLIDDGYIESVILLANKLLQGTAVSISALVLSKNNNQVEAVDASKIYHTENNMRIMTDADIEKIVSACHTDNPLSTAVPYSDIIANGYSVAAGYYVKTADLTKNSVPFSSLLKGYCCGLQLRPDDLNAIHSDVPTNYQYVEPKHIFNGEIDIKLPYLTECKDSYKNHSIKNHNIVISKLGRPMKIAVAEIPNDKIVIAIGRLFIFEIDEEKSDPYYIKRFLSSESGQEILSHCSESISVNNLKLDNLLKMPIKLEEK